jgi:hypothetical protein
VIVFGITLDFACVVNFVDSFVGTLVVEAWVVGEDFAVFLDLDFGFVLDA